MTQGMLSFKYEEEKKDSGMTALAGLPYDLLRYCEKGDNDRFGRIEFAIGCNVTQAFKIAVAQVSDSEWHPTL